jgi:hypothetical protein
VSAAANAKSKAAVAIERDVSEGAMVVIRLFVNATTRLDTLLLCFFLLGF